MTAAEIVAAITTLAELGKLTLQEVVAIHAAAADAGAKVLAHDAQLKPAPDPGPIQKG